VIASGDLEDNMMPKRLFARVARYSDAILAARLAGWTWSELSDALASTIGQTKPRSLANAFVVARRLAKEGLLVVEQLPLPNSNDVARDPAKPVDPSLQTFVSTTPGPTVKKPGTFINLDG
jgi:hypothetical protein